MRTAIVTGVVLIMGCGRGDTGDRDRAGDREAAAARERAAHAQPEAAPAEAPPAPTETATEAAPAAAGASQLLETVGDVGLVQLRAEGFDDLSLPERTLAYHLYRAAIAGDRIAYDQRFAHNVAIKDLMEAILTNAAGVDAAVLEKVREYTKLLWVHHGVHNAITSKKFVPTFTQEELATAARKARENGATLCAPSTDECLSALLERLRGPIFDAAADPYTVQKTPPDGQDILTASANTFYQGVTMADLRGFRDRYPLNSRVTKQGGRVAELVYRAGGGGAEPGLYADELGRVVRHVRDGLPFATESQRRTLGHLVRFFENGDPQAFRDYNVSWVGEDPKVDAILGFIESYGDARGAKGTWEGIVMFVDAARTTMMQNIAQNARYFEERTPWEAKYRRSEFRPLVANAVTAVVETGDGGPISPAGINLPNEQSIREQHGSRNFFLTNVTDASDQASGSRVADEFAWSPEEAAEIHRCGRFTWPALVALHEVTGHASGRVETEGDPHQHLRQYYSTLEEARADLVALWHLHDPKLVELGILPDAACADAGYRAFAMGAIAGLRKIPEGDAIEEDHLRARALILGYAMEKGAITEERRDGKFFVRVADPQAMRRAVGELLAELQRIKATGDFDAIAALVGRHATRLNTAWRDDAVARCARIGLPRYFAYVSPRLVETRDDSGRITDVRIAAPESFEALMLEWSRLARE